MMCILIYHGVPEEKIEHKLTSQLYSNAVDMTVSSEPWEHYPGWVHFLENWGMGQTTLLLYFFCSNNV